MFNTAQESDKNNNGSYRLPYFLNLVHVTGLDFHNSKSGKTLIKLELESKEDDPNFKGFERLDKKYASGKLATADLGIYIDATNFKQVANLLTNLTLLSEKAGIDYTKYLVPIFTKAVIVEDDKPVKLKEESQEYLMKVITAIVSIFKKHGKYFWVFINAEEYKPGKFGNYSLSQYNTGDKNNLNFLVWAKSEACVTKIYKGEGKDEDLTIGVEGTNTVGTNKGDTFKKMRQVGNEYELKPYKEGDYEDELSTSKTSIDENDSGDDDLPF